MSEFGDIDTLMKEYDKINLYNKKLVESINFALSELDGIVGNATISTDAIIRLQQAILEEGE